MKTLAIRTSIILFWLLLLLTLLYWPRIEWQKEEEKNSLNIFTWGDILDPEVVAAFERETGIKVHLSYYSSNEELLVKLKATKAEGYDLIVPSDYAVKILTKEGLLQPIDRGQLNFWPHINPLLLGQFFDPDNQYSIPFEWEIFGIGVNRDFFASRPFPHSWKLVFDRETIDYKIGMVNDPIEAVIFSSFYLFGPQTSLNKVQINAVRDLLIAQHQWVETYSDFRADYLLATKNSPAVIASSSYIWRTMRTFPFVSFVIPQEGTFITIENLCIPSATKKQDIIYQFINYLYTPESAAAHYETFGFFPSTLHGIHLMNLDPLARELILSPPEQFHRYHFTQVIMPEDELRDLWVEVKSR